MQVKEIANLMQKISFSIPVQNAVSFTFDSLTRKFTIYCELYVNSTIWKAMTELPEEEWQASRLPLDVEEVAAVTVSKLVENFKMNYPEARRSGRLTTLLSE